MHLHHVLDDMFTKGIERELEKLREQGIEGRRQILDEAKVSWALPSHIIVFLRSFIKNKENLKMRPRLQDWSHFRTTLFEIYDHRVQEASQELNGAINTTHVALDEHLVIFMSKLPDLGESSGLLAQSENSLRAPEIQQKLVNFLYSLKYYSTRWPRARMYAQLVGFLQENTGDQMDHDKFKEKHKDAIEGIVDDLEKPMVDLYLQEFFLYAYCMITKEKRSFETNAEDTQSFLKYHVEQRCSGQVFRYLYADRDRSVKDWILKVKEIVTKKRIDPKDDNETEFVDID